MSTPAFGLGRAGHRDGRGVAVLSSRVSERLRIPAPAFFLIVAAAAADLWPRLGGLSFTAVDQIVSVALAVILFDGGMRVGWRRMKSVAGATLWIGVAGTLVTAGGVAVLAHLILALDWRSALLLGAALAPTDPAVLFSVLGRREVAGRGGALLEGGSGSNDPVSIALLAALLAASGTGMTAVGHVATELLAQLIIGTAVGAAGGWALLAFMRRVPLPSESLYPLRVLAGALAIYGAATAVHGSGFLAVFVAGILIGDERAPYQREIARFHSALASLGIRFRHEPEGLHRFIVAPGAAADATPVGDLLVTDDAWISLLIRDGRLVPVRGDTILRAGDEAVVLSTDPDAAGLTALFAAPARRRRPTPSSHR